jgi:hypothetical protein
MTSERLMKLYEELVAFDDEFTDRRGYGDDSPVLLDNTESHVIDAAKHIVHNLYMFTEYPENIEVQHRFLRRSHTGKVRSL